VAICFAEFRVLSAAAADLPTGLAAYIARARYRSDVTGETFDHRWRGRDLIWSGLFLPDGADPIYAAPQKLWSAMERAEIRQTPKRDQPSRLTRKQHAELLARIDDPGEKRIAKDELASAWRDNAQLAFAVILALPKELSPAQLEDLVRSFVRDELLRHGFACQAAIHTSDDSGSPNIHAHLLIATREIDGLTIGNKIRGALGRFAGHKEYGSYLAQAALTPDGWAAYQNNYFLQHGINLQVDPKSPAPQTHVGPSMRVPNSDGLEAYKKEKVTSNEAIRDEKILLELMTEGRPTVTEAEVTRVLDRYGLTKEERNKLFFRLLKNPNFLPLFDHRTGALSGKFTSRHVRAQEHRIVDLARHLRDRRARSRQKEAFPPISDSRSSLIILEHSSEAARSEMMRLVDLIHLDADIRVVPLASTLPAAHLMSMGDFPGTKTVEQALSEQARGAAPAWNKKTCLLVDAADLLDPNQAEQLLAAAGAAGARVVLISVGAPRHAVGRGGSFAAIRAVVGPTALPVDDGPAAPPTQQGWRQGEVLPSIAFDAPRDRRGAIDPLEYREHQKAASSQAAGPIKLPARDSGFSAAGTRAQVHVVPRLPAPRPWRHPDAPASLSDFYNLSSHADCRKVAKDAEALQPEALFRLLRSLPSIDTGGAKSSSHPLTMLHRQLWGLLRKAGLNVATGRTHVACLHDCSISSENSWKDRLDLKPRDGFVDVRSLLAPIDLIDNDDWRTLTIHMSPFPKSVLEDIVRGLDDLFDRFYNNDDVKYAIWFAKLQIWIVAKDSGRDLVSGTVREDLWSLVPAADRIRRGLRLHDRDKKAAPILAASLGSTWIQESKKEKSDRIQVAKPKARSHVPIWLGFEAWPSNKEFHGDNPNRTHRSVNLDAATNEQRRTYQASLLNMFNACRHFGIRAWVGVGINDLVEWHQKHNTTPDPELTAAQKAAQPAIDAWKASRSGLANENPFLRGQAIWALRKRAIAFCTTDDRAKQLELAEKLLQYKQHSDMPAHHNDLVYYAHRAAAYLRTIDQRSFNPQILGQFVKDIKQRLAADIGEDALLIGNDTVTPQLGPVASSKVANLTAPNQPSAPPRAQQACTEPSKTDVAPRPPVPLHPAPAALPAMPAAAQPDPQRGTLATPKPAPKPRDRGPAL